MTRVLVWLSDDDHKRLIQLQKLLRAPNLDSAVASIIRFASERMLACEQEIKQ